MNILFIDPPFKIFTGFNNPFYPLGLAYLSAVCNKSGHKAVVYEVDAAEKTKTIDMDFSHEHQKLELYKKAINDPNNPIWDEIIHTVNDNNPDIIGITVMTTKIASALCTANIIKSQFADIPIVFGGPHATLLPEQCFKVDSVDYVIRGESEKVILQFLSFIEGDIEISRVNSLSYRDESGEIVHNLMEKPIENLNEIPFPDRDSLLYKDNYTSEDMGMIMATRGCPFNCTYCAHIFGRRVRKRSIENVMEEIRLVRRKYGTTQFSFKDDTFTVSKKWVTQLCNRLIEEDLGVNWDCTTRVDVIDEELVKLMKKAGCNDIRVGIETGSQRILDETKKGVTFEQVRTAAKMLNKNRVLWSGYFMYGLPTETVEDIRSTYKFMEELNPNYAGLGLYNPFPKTELFDRGVELGLIEDDVEIEHFFNTNPKDYYFKDPSRRVLDIEPEEFLTIEREIQEAFSKHNMKFSNLARRAFSRKSNYIKHPEILIKDVIKGLKMINLGD
jgi:radical SAM superfamily enzyme YgiQ (UPF0313 family)